MPRQQQRGREPSGPSCGPVLRSLVINPRDWKAGSLAHAGTPKGPVLIVSIYGGEARAGRSLSVTFWESQGLIHRSAWKAYSPKVGCRIVHKRAARGTRMASVAQHAAWWRSPHLVALDGYAAGRIAPARRSLPAFLMCGVDGVENISENPDREDGENGGPSTRGLYRGRAAGMRVQSVLLLLH